MELKLKLDIRSELPGQLQGKSQRKCCSLLIFIGNFWSIFGRWGVVCVGGLSKTNGSVLYQLTV